MKRKSLYIMSVALIGAMASLTGCGNQDNRTTIIYRSWDTGTETENNEERQLIKAFEQKENVRVIVVDNPGSNSTYQDGMDASVVTGIDLADVVMIRNLSTSLKNRYLLDIKQYIENDPEFAKVPSAVRDACKFKSGYYAIPARMNMKGYFVNTTIVKNKLGIDTTNLSVNSSYADIENIIDTAATVADVVGLDSAAHFIDTMASVLDNTESRNLGYFTWSGDGYHLDSEPFVNGVKAGYELFHSHKTLDAYSDEECEEMGIEAGNKTVDAWNKGKLALRWGATYEMKDMIENKTLGNSYKFIGNPGGKIPVVGDYYGIYAGTQQPELAYKFAKWMSFGKEGFTKRMEIYKSSGSVNSLPLQNDPELINKYFDYYGDSTDMRGLDDAYEYIKTKSMVEGVKVVPGYQSSRFDAMTGVYITRIDPETQKEVQVQLGMFDLLNYCIVGDLNISNYTQGTININTIANNEYTSWMNRYGKYYE